ncbi:hypothetical protein TPAR_05240 [Tolypocladium paradoxum]|uniref:Uncharacterized protein n=1 Tax=Tolypocladium paradoxum TaxID=94208 RepID=A0A2S4KWG4_9HYPO|nr:hypothetical protein TPAR_05240 [Tolypocladium paradoxum]
MTFPAFGTRMAQFLNHQSIFTREERSPEVIRTTPVLPQDNGHVDPSPLNSTEQSGSSSNLAAVLQANATPEGLHSHAVRARSQNALALEISGDSRTEFPNSQSKRLRGTPKQAKRDPVVRRAFRTVRDSFNRLPRCIRTFMSFMVPTLFVLAILAAIRVASGK